MIPLEKIETQPINKEIIPKLNLTNIQPLEIDILFDRYKKNI